jgi:hypothetical protein
MPNKESFYIGSGALNALVIETGETKALEAVIKAVVETPMSAPGPAERELNGLQEAAINSTLSDAEKMAKYACEKNDAEIASSYKRGGDGGKSLHVTLSCSLPPEECCQRGLVAARSAALTAATIARESVNKRPLANFKVLGL